MTFPTIPTVAAGRVLFTNQADTSGTRTFPNLSSLTKNSGDLLIAVVTTYQSSTNPQFSSWGGGFTELSAGGDQGTSSTLGIGIAYKISTGSETGTFTVTQAATVTGHASMCLMSIPLAHGTTAPEAGTIADGTSAAADPASFNPSGWGAEDTLWISVAASGMTSGTGSWTATGTTAPTNYGDRADSNTTDNSTVGQTEIAVSFRQLNAASEDVGTAGVDTSNARNSALVIAIRPAPTTHATTGVLTGPGTTVVGSASSATARPSSGALNGPGATVSGAAARTRQHATTGALAGQTATITGAAARTRQHATSGALSGGSAAISGTAIRFRAHATDGAITGAGSAIVGAASRTAGGSPVTHSTSGALAGSGAIIVGVSAGSVSNEQPVGGGIGHGREKKKRRVYIERDGKLLLFKSPADAAAYVSAEKAQESAEEPAKKPQRNVKKPRKAPEPQTIDVPALRAHYATREIARAVRNLDFDYLLGLQLRLQQLEEEDIEVLLLAA